MKECEDNIHIPQNGDLGVLRDSQKLLVWLPTFLRSSGKKCHLDVVAAGKCKKYYMTEGGGFPRVRVVVSHVSPGSLVACPNTKSAPECEPTNLLVGLMQVRVTK